MHEASMRFWRWAKESMPDRFAGTRICEIGSFNVNGSLREVFKIDVGVDFRKGPCVDIVSLAHKVNLPSDSFDAVVSASMLEHDPYWDLSIAKMVEILKPGGVLLLYWGAARCRPHEYTASPYFSSECRNPFHSRPAKHVVDILESLGQVIAMFKYEINLPFVRKCLGNGKEGVVLISSSEPIKELAWIGNAIDGFLKEDAVPLSR
jgi:hypothetical protein